MTDPVFFDKDIDTVKRKLLMPVKLTLHCRTCGSEMVSSGITLMSSPSQHDHYCPVDKTHPVIRTQGSSYPRMGYETVDVYQKCIHCPKSAVVDNHCKECHEVIADALDRHG